MPIPAGAKTGPDYARLKSALAASKLQKDNNSAYQSIAGLIDGVRKFQGFVSGVFDTVNGSLSSLFETVTNLLLRVAELEDIAINLIEVDTSAGPETVNLGAKVRGFTIIKDITGNAGTNNITCIGDVDGETDPIIEVPFGVLKVYGHTDGTFYRWENISTDGIAPDDGGQGANGCASCGVDGHPTAGQPLDQNTAGQIICGTAQEFPALVEPCIDQATRDANALELLLRMIWHLNLYGFTAGRQQNPSLLISEDKLTFSVGGVFWAYDVFLGVDFSAPLPVQMLPVAPASYVAEAGIAD